MEDLIKREDAVSILVKESAIMQEWMDSTFVKKEDGTFYVADGARGAYANAAKLIRELPAAPSEPQKE